MQVSGDVTNFSDVEAARLRIEGEFGPVDILVANAGGSSPRPARRYEPRRMACEKHRINWTRMLTLVKRWLPQPAVLHPFPDARFAATHPR